MARSVTDRYPPDVREAVCATICQRLAKGEALVTILDETPGMPSYWTVCQWLRTDMGFQDAYRLAREDAAEVVAGEIVRIADEAKDCDSAAAARVRVDARKWLAARLKPKVYGDRVDVNHTGEITTRNLTHEQLISKLAQLAGQLGVTVDIDAIRARLGISGTAVGAVGSVQRSKLREFYPETGPLRRELYPRHLEFFAAGRKHRERLMLAANRVGKTEGVGGYEVALHLTGAYPDWWPGRRFLADFIFIRKLVTVAGDGNPAPSMSSTCWR